MRFSAMQDNGYGVGLAPQDRLYGNMDGSTMAISENNQSKNNTMDEGPMISNLPLLFADGYPTSLEKITLVQLERFVTFMVQCSLGNDSTEEIVEPQWWPKEVKFSNPLIRPKTVTETWMANLKKLVFRCYTYHRSDYLLRFCSCLARYPQEELEYINNWDSTTSLYHKSTGKLLVTFRNENLVYDKRHESPRKKLLSHNGAATSNPNKAKQQLHSFIMVEPSTEDIYLCDNCDAEFTGLDKIKEHERICCEPEPGCSIESSSNSRPNTPDLSMDKPELQQKSFLEYFHLQSSKLEPKSTVKDTSTTTNNNVVRRTRGRLRGAITFTRCPTIPFSSPAGIFLAKKSKVIMTEETLQERLERIERHLLAPVLSTATRPKWLDSDTERDKWVVTHKPNRDKPADCYVHEYRFVNSVKRKPTLSIQSQLLYIVCRPVYVLLTRLTQEQIDELKRDPSKYRCPIRKVSAIKKEFHSGIRTKPQTYVSSKRKAPGDEDDLIVERPEERPYTTSATPLTACQLDTMKYSETATNTKTENSTPLQSPRSIAIIDLCSSDEDDDHVSLVASDENRDPLKSNDTELNKPLVGKLTATKFCTKPCIYSTDTTGNWLSGSVLKNDCESFANKYRNSVMLNTCANLSPILRPAP